MKTKRLEYLDGTTTLEAYVAYQESNEPRPLVLISHAWAGRDQFVMGKAEQMAQLGLVGFALDMYGQGKLGSNIEENSKLMMPFMEDRSKIKQRMHLALETARALPFVDETKVIAIGFCFGGLCVLDLARSGADIAGVVSFHGLFDPPFETQAIQAKVLAFHGDQDPMVPADKVQAFKDEMTQAGADWQLHIYGNTQHAFTNPEAKDPNLGTIYNPSAEQRAWQSFKHFIAECFD